MTDEVIRAGPERLASELYDVRRLLALVEVGERALTNERLAQLRWREAELDGRVGSDLDALLAADATACASYLFGCKTHSRSR